MKLYEDSKIVLQNLFNWPFYEDEKQILTIGTNGEPTLLVHCLYWMLPLNHKRTTSSLVPPIIFVANKSAINI